MYMDFTGFEVRQPRLETFARVFLASGTTDRIKLTRLSSLTRHTGGNEQIIAYHQYLNDEWAKAVGDIIEAGRDGSFTTIG
jgi:hypothetical protein